MTSANAVEIRYSEGAQNGPGNRAANSARGLTPEAESEALMSISPHPCDATPGVT